MCFEEPLVALTTVDLRSENMNPRNKSGRDLRGSLANNSEVVGNGLKVDLTKTLT